VNDAVFPRACLGDTDEILALEYLGNSARLNGCGLGIAGIGDGFEKLGS
jgi:hypothetical protein